MQATSEVAGAKPLVTVVLCHSFIRCAEVAETLNELVSFCTEMVDVVNLDSNDLAEVILKLKLSMQESGPMRSRVIVATPSVALKLKNKGIFDKMVCHSVVLDKVDLLQGVDFGSDLKQLSFDHTYRCVMTTTDLRDEKDKPEDELEEFKEIKLAAMGSAKALVIRMNTAVNSADQSMFERIEHLYTMCENQLDKFMLLFSMVKLAVLQGKTVVMCNDVIQAYRIKLFLNRFSLRCFVLAPDMPKNQIGSIVHFFHIGQFDIVVMLHTGYSSRPKLENVATVINFDMPTNYNSYKESGQIINDETGAVLSLLTPSAKEQMDLFRLLEHKFSKNFGRDDMLKCVPVMWTELTRLKSRVETVLNTLSNKAVQNEKVIEFKKQLVSNKSLKSYFAENPEEKEILLNDITKVTGRKDRYLFKNLDVMPSYVIPEAIMA